MKQFDESQKITQAVLNDIRTTSYLLHPPFLDEMGLQAGLRWYVQEFQERSNLKIELNIAETLEQLPAELS